MRIGRDLEVRHDQTPARGSSPCPTARRQRAEPGTSEVGAQVTVTATRTSDSVFQNWSVDGTVVSAEVSSTVTVSTDQVLTANFR
ncbi:hypothetical protein AB0F43_25175 [Kribbella sp. NPDC023972]|uniref:InlB B-repeat-containing protein n=1 Tax=Kribbella sp. NPDC023972 TaxID=3154795 RepID=UPI0033EF5F32